MGCCFGTDLRQLRIDGFPLQSLFGIDVEESFLDIGTDILFHDREQFRNRFVKVDVLRPNFKVVAPASFRLVDNYFRDCRVRLLTDFQSYNSVVIFFTFYIARQSLYWPRGC